MARLLVIDVSAPQDLLDEFGAGALARLERDTVSTFATASEITTLAIVAGTTEYEYRDQTGTTSHVYRYRFSTAAPTLAVHHSAYRTIGTDTDYTNLELVRRRLMVTDTTDDGELAGYVQDANEDLHEYIGIFYGPSIDTTRTFDGRDAVRNGKRLWIPGGVRSIGTLTMGYTGEALTEAASADWVLGPVAWELRPGQPYAYIEFLDVTTGSWTMFPYGMRNVTAAGSEFGADRKPSTLVRIATDLAVARFMDRKGAVGGGDLESRIFPYLTAPQRATLDRFRLEARTWRSI